MAKVSVIIPVYGVEAYIEKCVRSLCEQTLDDIEYIFVDDCSPDRSIQILNQVLLEYPERQKNCRIIRMPSNQKQHKARKRGIEEASGDYIIHCDPDDYVEHSMYKTLYDKAVEGNYDLVWCGFNRIENEQIIKYKEECACKPVELLTFLLEGKLMGSLWNKLVKREIVQNPIIIQPQSPFIEDLLLVSQYVMLAKSFCYCKGEFYNYVYSESSIVSYYGSSVDILLERVEVVRKNLILLHQAIKLHSYNNELYPSMLLQKFNLKRSLMPLVIQKESSSYWIKCFPEINFSLFFCNKITLCEKLRSFLLLTYLYIPFRKVFAYFHSNKSDTLNL